jgi:glycosyltransferase involved in cell wall biosynthesis
MYGISPKPHGQLLRVVVDGVVYGFQKHGGINTLFGEVLPRLGRRADTVIDLLVPAGVVGRLPQGQIGRLGRYLLPGLPIDYSISWPEPSTRSIIHELIPHSSDANMGALVGQVLRRARRWVDDQVMRLRLCENCHTVFHSTYFTIPNCPVPQVATALDLNHELLRDFYDFPLGDWLRLVIKESIVRADHVLAISQATKRDVCRVYKVPETKVDVVHLAVNPQEFFRERNEGQLNSLCQKYNLERPYVLFVGDRAGFKNFACLQAAFDEGHLDRDYDLVAAGPPWHEGDTQVKAIAWPSTSELRALYSLARAFVYPSMGEGFGLPLLEAMACGTPVVASDIPVFREVAGNAAEFFDPRSPAELTDALRRALVPRHREELIERGRDRSKLYSWDRAARETRVIYEKALAAWKS